MTVVSEPEKLKEPLLCSWKRGQDSRAQLVPMMWCCVPLFAAATIALNSPQAVNAPPKDHKNPSTIIQPKEP